MPPHVVASVIVRGGQYLVCLRPEEKRHGGLWEFPGGKMLDGETHLEAARRELLEELGLEVVSTGGVLMSVTDRESGLMIDFVPTEVLGEPVAHEHSEIRWLRLERVIDLSLAPADRVFVGEHLREAE